MVSGWTGVYVLALGTLFAAAGFQLFDLCRTWRAADDIPTTAAMKLPATIPSPIEVAASSSSVVAKPIWQESLECPDALSAGARNLLRTGFEIVGVRTVWQPPEELIPPAEEGEAEEGEWGGRDGDGEDEDGDEDHDFVLGG